MLALAIKADSQGPLLHVQPRLGKCSTARELGTDVAHPLADALPACYRCCTAVDQAAP